MVTFRLLQGVFGAALVPLSQSVMLDAYPPEQRGQAMAIWGMGVMLGPDHGPDARRLPHRQLLLALGVPDQPAGRHRHGARPDRCSWTRRKQQTHLRFDWFGFLALAIGIGSLQLMLDRGEQVGWFGSAEIVVELIISVAGFYFFFAHSLTTDEPFVRFEMFKDRNFAAGCLFMVVIGVVLFGTMALITPFMQNLLGYPIMTAGFAARRRAASARCSAMMAVGRLLKFVEARYARVLSASRSRPARSTR